MHFHAFYSHLRSQIWFWHVFCRSRVFPESVFLIIVFPQEPVSLDNVTTKGLVPDIHVKGNVTSKKYDFMMGNLQTYNPPPYKIAQVSWGNFYA